MQRALTLILTLAVAPVFGQQQSNTVYQWQEPMAEVTEAGAIKWTPKPFDDDLSEQEVRYIDYENGDDGASGRSPESAWKHHPWDLDAFGNAAAAAETSPLTTVFKRGVIYRGQLYAKASGTEDQPIRLTSTAAWGQGPAILAGSVRLPDEWKRVDQAGVTAPEHMPDLDKVWVLDLGATDWWQDGQAGRNIANPDSFGKPAPRSQKVEAPFIGLFTVDEDFSSDWKHLARWPDWQPAGTEFAHDYWPAWDGNIGTITTTDGTQVNTQGGYDDDLKGKPEDFFVGGIIWSTYPSLMGGATPSDPIRRTITDKNGNTFSQYDPSKGGFSLLIPNGNFNRGTRYKIENVPGLLDTAGEFYIDQDNDLLYYRPEAGIDPNDLDFELVVDHQTLVIEDHDHIEVSGLEFRYTDGMVIDLRGDIKSLTFANNAFRDLMEHPFYNWLKPDEESFKAGRPGKDWQLEKMDGVVISDNRFQRIWDSCIDFGDGRSWQHNRIGRGIGGHPWGVIENVEILRNNFEDIGIRHQDWRYTALPIINVGRAVEGRIAGNVIKRSFGSGIMVHGGSTGGIEGSEWPLTRILIYQNSTEDTALAVNDYGGFSLWQGGLIYCYGNNIGNSTGFMPGGLWGNPQPRTLSYPYYIDGGFKIVAFNNIIWDRSIEEDDPYRSETAGYFSVFGFLNHFTNNTLYRHARGTGGSSGNRTDLVSNVFAEIGGEFIRNNRVENPSLVGGGDTGASGIQGVPSLAYGRNIFHGPAEAGELVADSGEFDVPVDIVGPSIEEMAAQMQEFPVRWGQLGWEVEERPIVGELSPNALTDEGDAGGDFRLLEGSRAIDAGAQYFYPWALGRTVGEWHFTKNHAAPSIVTDFALFMGEVHFERFMYNQVPTLPLSLSDATLESYVPAPSEDWVNGAVAFDGQRFAKVTDREMRADFELDLAAYISNTGQRTYANFDKAINREVWEVPEPDIEKNGQPAFSEGKTAVYPGERRNTLISTIRNLLLEARFKTEPGHTGGYLANKRDGRSGYALAIDEQGRAVFTVMANGEQDSVTTAEPVNDGRWRHVLAEIDRETGRMTIYLDGETSGESTSGLSAATSIDNEADFVVARSSAAEDGYFTGAIDFLRVCHATLEDSKTSIGELYAWQYVSGPHLFDMRGQEPVGERRDAGALERISFDGLLTESLDREYWTGISGTEVGDLTGHADYPDSPTASDTLTRFEAVDWNDPDKTQEWADSYGQRIRGYIVPEVTGAYTFWIASDEQSELWLSTDSDPANASKIAHVDGYATQYQYNKSGTQKSSSIRLAAGAVYYVEVLHKEGGGGDHVSVAWSTDSGITPTSADIIPGSVLSAFSAGVPGGGGGSTVIAEDASDSVHEGTRKNVAVLDGDRLCSLIRAYENGDDL
ncbi:MAG: LamG-like jellyroll fold domain-containing protein [Opitutales bacterium]